jgi:hypothetical protein
MAQGSLKGTTRATDGYTADLLKTCNTFDHDAVASAARKYPAR